MTFDEYVKSGRARYEALVHAVQMILAAAVEQHDLVPHGIKGRAKDPDSLAKKLAKEGIDPASAIDTQLKDLAGARIVFLNNGEVDRFGHEGILRENFEVVNVNVHHPVPGTETESRRFDSTNYTVELKPERLALPEYAAFAGMRCEIQVQTLLNHAWAEMDHDAFYKQPDIGRIGTKRLEVIKRRMNDVMDKYLVPAGHDFDQIAGDMHRLIEADGSYDATFATLASSNDNRELSDALGTFDDLILPQVDEPHPLFLKHLPDLIGAVERARGSAAGKVETPYGSYPGPSGEEVARRARQLIARARYIDPAATFDALVRLHAGAVTDTERKIWIDVGRELSANNLAIWKGHGPAIARTILDGIAKLDAAGLGAARGLIAPMLGNILSADVQGMSSNAGTVTIHHGVIPVSAEVIAIRQETIALLGRLLDAAPDDAARGALIAELRKAGQHPFNGGTAELAILIRRDAAAVLRIEIARIPGWGLELRRQSEINALHVHHRFEVLPEFLAGSEDAAAAQAELVDAIAALRGALGDDAEYALYKTLAGRDSVRPAAWEGDAFGWRPTEAWRTAAYPEIVGGMADDAADAWVERARLFIAEARGGRAELFPLGNLFRIVAKEKPRIAGAFLEAMDDGLAILLRPILLGLDEAGEQDRIRRAIARWQGEGRFLSAIVDYLRFRTPADVDMLAALTARAIELVDDEAVIAAMTAAIFHFDENGDRRLITDIFMPAIGFLIDAGKQDWVHYIWGGRDGKLIAALDEGEAQRLLASFGEVREVGFEEDRILAFVAARFPNLVFEFFETRIRRGREQGDSPRRFSPIPFEIHELREALVPYPELVIAAARRWYDIVPELHEFYGGRFFHNVYPELPDAVVARLRDLVAGGDAGDIRFVTGLLNAYEGSERVYPLCMDIVDALGEGDVLLSSVVRVLAQTGVLVGEFGFVEAEAAQRARIEAYKDDPRPKVKAFVRDQARRIQQSMAAEQRRAVRQVAARKRQWGEE